jgi:hypothetical protein
VSGARAEAFQRLGGRFDVRVLEPSPPAVQDPPWFADDPVAGGEIVPVERPGTRSWQQLCRDEGDPALDRWCTDRWLAAWRPLAGLPAEFPRTREALHRLAEHVLAPARHRANGKIGLRFTYRGFGTPFFGDDRQVRVEGAELILHVGHEVIRAPLASLGTAAALLHIEPGAPEGVYTPSTALDADLPLEVDEVASLALGDWYGFCASVLEQLRSEASDATRVQLWPEHLDLAVDLGMEALGRRANYGGSPGDAEHPGPYLYVGPWTAMQGAFWNEAFGASLPYSSLLAAADQRETALAFFRQGRSLLAARVPGDQQAAEGE